MGKDYCVYRHTSPSGKVYIGITCRNPLYRWNGGKGYSENRIFFDAIIKYGWDNFKHEILYDSLTKEEAEKTEIELIEKHKSNQIEYGYNHSIGGDCRNKGTSKYVGTVIQNFTVLSIGGKKYTIRCNNCGREMQRYGAIMTAKTKIKCECMKANEKNL